jgi:hypothetical protein
MLISEGTQHGNFQVRGRTYTTIPGVTISNFTAIGPVLLTLEVPCGRAMRTGAARVDAEAWFAITVNGAVQRDGFIHQFWATGWRHSLCLTHVIDTPTNWTLEGQVRSNFDDSLAYVFATSAAILRAIQL